MGKDEFHRRQLAAAAQTMAIMLRKLGGRITITANEFHAAANSQQMVSQKFDAANDVMIIELVQKQ